MSEQKRVIIAKGFDADGIFHLSVENDKLNQGEENNERTK